MTAFGEMLRRLRQEHGMSLAELSQLVHYSKGYLSMSSSARSRLPKNWPKRAISPSTLVAS